MIYNIISHLFLINILITYYEKINLVTYTISFESCFREMFSINSENLVIYISHINKIVKF